MAYPYKQIFAVDESAPERVAQNGVVTIFAPGNTTQTPLTITSLGGLPLPNPIQVNGEGYGPPFMHATLPQVAWSGAGLSGTFESYEGMRDEAVAARVAAQEAAALAQAPTDESIDQGIQRADIPTTVAAVVAAAPTVTAAAAAAVNAAPKIVELENKTIPKALSDAKIYTDASKWERRALVAGEDLNSITAPGAYNIGTYTIANSLLNRPLLPSAVNPATVTVKRPHPTLGVTIQTWETAGSAASTNPTMQRQRDNGGVWSAWVRADDIAPETRVAVQWVKRALIAGEDLNALTVPGHYNAPTYAIANSLLQRPPVAAAIQPAAIEVLAVARGQISQRWATTPSASQASLTMQRHRDNEDTWSEWRRTDDIAPETLAALRAELGAGTAVGGTTGSVAGAVDWSRKQREQMVSIMLAMLPAGSPIPTWAWSAPTGRMLSIPTHEGSGQVVHPSVLYFPQGWNGYEYWMAHTPYPFGAEKHEDPNIVASHDGDAWVVPVGLTNPLDDQTGNPSPYNSDTHLMMGPNGEMICTWRMVDRPDGGRNRIFWRTSTDGVNWTPKVEIMARPNPGEASTLVSQSLHRVAGKWRLYGIDTTANPNRLVYFESSAAVPATGSWGPLTVCPTPPVPAGRDWWHVDIQNHNGEWVGIMNDVERGTAGVDGDIFFMRSVDGVNWDVSPLSLIPKISSTHDSIYKTGFIPSGSGSNLTLDVFYSAFPRGTREFRTYRVTAVRVGA